MNQTTIDRAYAELAEAKKAARESRRAFRKSPDSAFVRVMQGAISQYLDARRQGVSREDGIRGIEAELRGAWPKSVSKFNRDCDGCDDTGWREVLCWDQHRCSREVCAKNPERQHLYVVICDCAKGDRFRAKQRTTEDAIAAAGRTAKRKSGSWRQVGS